MKGFKYDIKHHIKDCTPCFFCKHREEICADCEWCVSDKDLALGLPDSETEFTHFEPRSEAHEQVLQMEQGEKTEEEAANFIGFKEEDNK